MYLILPFLSQEEDDSKKQGETKNKTRKKYHGERQLWIWDSEQSRSLLKNKNMGTKKKSDIFSENL